MSVIKKLFEWYLDNQNSLVEKYNGKTLIIKDNSVVGAFDSEKEAYFAATDQYDFGTFIIQKCSPGTKDYTQTFHSRVAFA
jgi:hypothetical protein